MSKQLNNNCEFWTHRLNKLLEEAMERREWRDLYRLDEDSKRKEPHYLLKLDKLKPESED